MKKSDALWKLPKHDTETWSKQMLLFKKKGLLNIELPPTSNLLKTNEKEKKTQYL